MTSRTALCDAQRLNTRRAIDRHGIAARDAPPGPLRIRDRVFWTERLKRWHQGGRAPARGANCATAPPVESNLRTALRDTKEAHVATNEEMSGASLSTHLHAPADGRQTLLMVRWYGTVLGAEVVHSDGMLAFLTYGVLSASVHAPRRPL